MSFESLSAAEAKRRGYDPDTIAQLELEEEAKAEAKQLIRAIEQAFADIARPRITRSVAVGYDDEWKLTEERIQQLTAQDPEQCWSDVPDEAMQYCQEYFCFADAEGWQFYLPAYLCQYLRGFPNFGWDAVYEACVSAAHVDLLTQEQLQCLDDFLALCHKYENRL